MQNLRCSWSLYWFGRAEKPEDRIGDEKEERSGYIFLGQFRKMRTKKKS
jgi:hypothetical protein